MHVAFVTQAIVPFFLNTYIVILDGVSDRKQGREYGKLIQWDDHPDGFEWMITQRQFQPGEALFILEVQERVMAFLVDCCKEILHDIPAGQLASDLYPTEPEPLSKSENNVNGHVSLAVMATERPYRLPADLDLSRVSSLLSAITVAKEDILWSLREDPSYFAQWLSDRSEHQMEMMVDTHGKKHPTLHRQQEDVFWGRLIPRVVLDTYLELETFSDLSRQALKLQDMQIKYQGEILPEKDLPAEYIDALVVFRYCLDQAAKRPMNALKTEVLASAPFRPFFVRTAPTDLSSSMMHCISTETKMGKIEGQLFWLLETIWEDDKSLFLLRLPILVDELQRLLDAEPKAKAMVTERINDIIGDLAIICECLRQLDNYHPWALTFENKMVDKEKEIEEDFKKMCAPKVQMENALKACNQPLAAQLGKPTDGKFDYPVWRRRNRENAEIMRKSEASLDAFWSYFDKHMKGRANDLQGTAMRELLTSRILQRTQAWSDPKTSDKKAANRDHDSPKPLSEVYSELESRTSKTLATTAARVLKEKAKTWGLPTPSTSTPTVPEANDLDPQPTFALDARALKVFRTLFFVPSTTATPGEVPWPDFLHAMAATGFRAEKLYGSVWHFTPTALDVERSIQFPEPHPSGKIPYRIARRHGRRLHRAYGWHGARMTLITRSLVQPVGMSEQRREVMSTIELKRQSSVQDVVSIAGRREDVLMILYLAECVEAKQ